MSLLDGKDLEESKPIEDARESFNPRLYSLGWCAVCDSEIEHHMDEPFSNCKCGQGEDYTPGLLSVLREELRVTHEALAAREHQVMNLCNILGLEAEEQLEGKITEMKVKLAQPQIGQTWYAVSGANVVTLKIESIEFVENVGMLYSRAYGENELDFFPFSRHEIYRTQTEAQVQADWYSDHLKTLKTIADAEEEELLDTEIQMATEDEDDERPC